VIVNGQCEVFFAPENQNNDVYHVLNVTKSKRDNC
jgi:hypothetical protein